MVMMTMMTGIESSIAQSIISKAKFACLCDILSFSFHCQLICFVIHHIDIQRPLRSCILVQEGFRGSVHVSACCCREAECHGCPQSSGPLHCFLGPLTVTITVAGKS